jgi:very-short-patch-repair endonuclease
MRGPDAKSTSRARRLRNESTSAEKILWSQLRNRQIDDAKFVRQHPIGPYIADFVCRSSKLVIEIDGPTHEGREAYDAQRTEHLEKLGYRVIRFANEDIFGDLDPVIARIIAHL